jgi:tRNA threonylcarbamoyladenosine biosynthesis protein TsaB
MKSLLALDTSTDACSVCLQLADSETFVDNHKVLPREHTQNILPMVDDVLQQGAVSLDTLDGFVVGAGPGSFTGLRIAFGVIQGLAFAVSKPVAMVSTLAAMAQQMASCGETGTVLVVLDARMSEVYWAKYQITENAELIEIESAQVSKFSDISLDGLSAIAGSGLVYLDYELSIKQFPELMPTARSMLELVSNNPSLVSWTEADKVEPLYVRNNVAKKKAQQK